MTAFCISWCSVMLCLVPFFSAGFARQFVAEPALVCVVVLFAAVTAGVFAFCQCCRYSPVYRPFVGSRVI